MVIFVAQKGGKWKIVLNFCGKTVWKADVGKQSRGTEWEKQFVRFGGSCDWLRSMSVVFCFIGIGFGSVTINISLFAQFVMFY